MADRIFIVEPDVIALRNITQFLRSEGFEVHLYPDAERALAECKQIQPHLIISEWELPGKSGEQFCVETQKLLPGVPFLFLSEVRDPALRVRAINAGAVDYLFKPFDRDLLLAKIKRFVSLYKLIEERKREETPIALSHTFLDFVKEQGVEEIRPEPDLESPLGFSYPLIQSWSEEPLSIEEQIEVLEQLAQKGWLEKRIFDIVKRCPQCKSINLNIRMVCPHCHSPVMTKNIPVQDWDGNTPSANDGDSHYHCSVCGAKFDSGVSFARCFSCGSEFEESKSIPTILYAYSLKLPQTGQKSQMGIDWLRKKAEEMGLSVYPEELIEPFRLLISRQHDLARRAYAETEFIFPLLKSGVTPSGLFARHLVSALLLIKKYSEADDVFFVQSPNRLICFLPFVDPDQAQKRMSRLGAFLERLNLNTIVQIKLNIRNVSKLLDFLAEDVEDEQFPQ